jgi:hypothetical protein
LSPLVANTGIGPGDTVVVTGNPISCALQRDVIASLRGRRVNLSVDCP